MEQCNSLLTASQSTESQPLNCKINHITRFLQIRSTTLSIMNNSSYNHSHFLFTYISIGIKLCIMKVHHLFGLERRSSQKDTEVNLSYPTLPALKGWSLRCFIYSLVSQSNYNSSHQALPFHTLTGCQNVRVEGTVILKVGQSAHLTSFPNTLLCLFHKSLLIGVHLKRGLWVLTGESTGGKSSLSAAWETSFLEHDSDCSQS